MSNINGVENLKKSFGVKVQLRGSKKGLNSRSFMGTINKKHIQHDSLIFTHFLQFIVNVRTFLFLYDWIEH
jgi:hypothetical protein